MNKFLPIIMSGILALPTMAFAASSVRTLGGAGTYNGVTSVGSGTATRAGSVRAVPAVKVSSKPSVTTSSSTSGSTGTVSGNTGTGTRMSIGKYLSGSGVVSSKVSTSTAGAINLPEFEAKFFELQQQVTALESSDEGTKTELEKIWKSLDDAAKELDTEYLTEAEIKDLNYIDEAALGAALEEYTKSALIEEIYAKKADILSQENVSQIIANAITDPNTGVLKNYATKDELENQVLDLSGNIIDQIGIVNERINSVEAGIPSFSISGEQFDPGVLGTGN